MLDKAVSFLRAVCEMENGSDRRDWISLLQAFSDVLAAVEQKICEILARPTTPTQGHCIVSYTGEPGRPKIQLCN